MRFAVKLKASKDAKTMAMYELMACKAVLGKWKASPTSTKHQIGVWAHWMDGEDGTDVPLSPAEVCEMKAILRRLAPSQFAQLFPDEVSFVAPASSTSGTVDTIRDGTRS